MKPICVYPLLFVSILLLPATGMAQLQVLTLPEAVQTAIQNNYDVVIARNEAGISKINNNWGATGLLPTAAINGNKTIATNSITQELANGTTIKRDGASVNNFNAGLAVSWRFFDGMRMFATKRRLEQLEKTGELAFRKMVNQTAFDVISAYLDIVRLKQQAKAVEEIIALYQERLRIAEYRFNIGTGNKPDVLQAKVDLNEQQSALLGIRNNISIGKTNLNALLARDPATVFETVDSFAQRAPLNFEQIRQQVLLQNPDILMAASSLAILMETKKEINAQRLPTATLNGNYNFIRNKSAAGFTLLNQTYGPSGSLGISIPLFSGLVVKQQLKAADLQIKNQQVMTDQLKNQLLSTLTTAYLSYENGNRLAELEQQNMAIVQENNSINLERYRLSAITAIEFRQGQVNYSDAFTRLINARYQASVAEAQLLLLAGTIAE